jgi:hypothetical protein
VKSFIVADKEKTRNEGQAIGTGFSERKMGKTCRTGLVWRQKSATRFGKCEETPWASPALPGQLEQIPERSPEKPELPEEL